MDATTIRKAARFVHSLESTEDLASFRANVMPGLAYLLSAEVLSYNEIDHTQAVRASVVDYYPLDATPRAQLVTAFAQWVHQHPLIRHYARTGDRSARKISDFLTPGAFHRLELYQAFFRPLRLEAQMAVTLPAGAGRVVGIACNRSRADFSEADRALLDLLRPHIVHAYRGALLFERAREVLARSPGDVDAPYGLIELDRARRICRMTPSAERLMRAHLGRAARSGGSLAAELDSWARHRRGGGDENRLDRGPGPLVLAGPAGTLWAWWLPGEPGAGSDRVLLCSTMDIPADAPAAQPERRLTRREMQVLNALARGMRNAEIARHLQMSPRTVDKHLEHIYRKLEVQSRTGAVAAFAAVGRRRLSCDREDPSWSPHG